jgi:hypothetical protein
VRLVAGILLAIAFLMGCDRPNNDVTSLPDVVVLPDTGFHYTAKPDTTPRDTILVKPSKKFPAVDSFSLVFVARKVNAYGVVSPTAMDTLTRRKSAAGKDTLICSPLDTGRLWLLKAQGFKKGRLWWTLDSIPVFPDSVKIIVLDSFAHRLKIADTSTPVVVVPVDTNLYLDLADLAGSPLPSEGKERGLFLNVDSGRLVLSVSSDGNVFGSVATDRVFNAKVDIGFSTGGTVGAASLVDPVYNGKVDSDSISRMLVKTRPGSGVESVSGNMFARYRLKTLTIPASKCTVSVVVNFRSGVIPYAPADWIMPSIASDSAKAFIFLGQGRVHPSKTHFRIVIP